MTQEEYEDAVRGLQEAVERIQRVRDDLGDPTGEFGSIIMRLRLSMAALRKMTSFTKEDGDDAK